MSNETRVYGPPGTGKTSKLANEIIPMLVEKYGKNKVMITSFTKAAASELGSRITLENDDISGTLHSICYKALKNPALTEEHLNDWDNEYSNYAIRGDSELGKECYSEYQILRNKLIPREDWRGQVTGFASKWEAWKDKHKYLDFMDLIEEAGKLYAPPTGPSAIVIDEAQDFTKLEMSLLRRWSSNVREFWVVGDDDQCIYTFAGSSPENMLYPEVPEDQKIILSQSWRVPAEVHKVAEKIIKQVTIREPKIYKPRNADGKVIYGDGTFKSVDWAIKTAIKENNSCMFITTCNYMLFELVKELRNRGIPFSNPWRIEDKSWNPLQADATNILISFLGAGTDKLYWDVKQFVAFAKYLKVGPNGLIRKQGKLGIIQLEKILEEAPATPGLHTCNEFLDQILSPDAMMPAIKRDLDWLVGNMVKAKAATMKYPIQILKQHGRDALLKRPIIHIGTIHCSPPDELILTTNGYVPIGKLNPAIHRIAGYHYKTNKLVWGYNIRKEGYTFKITNRDYDGDLITITTKKSKTRVTPNHSLRVKFSSNFFEKWVVYLMKRGDWWRIGLCVSGHRPYRSGGIGGRLSSEKGNCAWILGVYKTRAEAIFTEAKLQSKFGITGLIFENNSKQLSLTTTQIHEIHNSCSKQATIRATKLLSTIGMNINEPLWTRSSIDNNDTNYKKRNMHNRFEIKAMNFLSGYMEMIVPEKSFINKEKLANGKPLMLLGKTIREKYIGKVYSLDVPPHHFYISGGAVVHNSFKGAEANTIFLYPDISYSSKIEMESKEGFENMCRLFYVGVTRARNKLFIMQPASKNFFEI